MAEQTKTGPAIDRTGPDEPADRQAARSVAIVGGTTDIENDDTAPYGETHRAAGEYTSRGWPVFVLSRTKKPLANCEPCRTTCKTAAEKETCACLTCHGFYAATLDADRVAEMLRLHPAGMLAIRTGAMSGLAVVDVDFRTFEADGSVRRDDDAWRTLCALDRDRLLPGTVTAMTPSGGLHLLYRHPGGYLLSGANKFGPGIDSKADGGYIVVAPSRDRRGAYAWTGDGRFDHPLPEMPEALCARLRPPAVVPAQTPHLGPSVRPGVNGRRFAAVLQRVLDAHEGERNDVLWWASRVAGEMVAAGDITEAVAADALQRAGREVGLTVGEIGTATTGTIGSGLRRGRVVAA